MEDNYLIKIERGFGKGTINEGVQISYHTLDLIIKTNSMIIENTKYQVQKVYMGINKNGTIIVNPIT